MDPQSNVPWHQSTGFKIAAPLVIATILLIVANMATSTKPSPKTQSRSLPTTGNEVLDDTLESGRNWVKRADRALGRGVDILLDRTEATLDKNQQRWNPDDD